MKKRFILILFFCVIISVSCEKLLTEKPYSVVAPDNFFKTQKDFETACFGTIAILASGENYGQFIHYIIEYPAFDYAHGFVEFQNLTSTSTSSFVLYPWRGFYKVINECNTILSKIDDISFDEKFKNALKGEILFFRALSYFNLVKIYGGVPLHLKPTTSLENVILPKSTSREVYDIIVKDLQDASGLLNITNPYGVGRATKGSALGLLAKVYVFMAGKPGNDISKWQAAQKILTEMINTANPSTAKAPFAYALLPDYQRLYWNVYRGRQGGVGASTITAPAIENSSEAVYELNYKGVSGYASCIYPESLGTVLCSPWLASKFDVFDYRKQVTMVVNSGDPLGVIRFHRKFVSTGDFYNNHDNNWPVLRYADLVLLLAEVENEINGPTSLALDAINAIRKRARNAGGTPRLVPADYTITDAASKDQMRLLIEKERILELSCEGQTWFDWIRTNRLQAVLTEQGRGSAYQPMREVFPIPQSQIDISQGVLKQNDGY